MNEEDYIESPQYVQINQQDWRDGTGGDDNNSPLNSSTPNSNPEPPAKDIPTLSNEEATKLNEWRESPEFQAGLEKIKGETLNQENIEQDPDKNLSDPPEKIKKIALNLQYAFKGFNWYIVWDNTFERQVHKALESIETKEEFKQLVDYYNANYAQNKEIPSLKEDLYQELKDTPKDFLKALAVYNKMTEEEDSQHKSEDTSNKNNAVSDDKIAWEITAPEVTVADSPPPVISQHSKPTLDLPKGLKSRILKVKDDSFEGTVFIENPKGAVSSATIDKDKLTYNFRAYELGEHKITIAYKTSEQTEVQEYETTAQVISQEDYAQKAFDEADAPADYDKLQEQITIQEFLASNMATDDNLPQGAGFHIVSDQPNPINTAENYKNGTAIFRTKQSVVQNHGRKFSSNQPIQMVFAGFCGRGGNLHRKYRRSKR